MNAFIHWCLYLHDYIKMFSRYMLGWESTSLNILYLLCDVLVTVGFVEDGS